MTTCCECATSAWSLIRFCWVRRRHLHHLAIASQRQLGNWVRTPSATWTSGSRWRRAPADQKTTTTAPYGSGERVEARLSPASTLATGKELSRWKRLQWTGKKKHHADSMSKRRKPGTRRARSTNTHVHTFRKRSHFIGVQAKALS
jgi:hypothetical protein